VRSNGSSLVFVCAARGVARRDAVQCGREWPSHSSATQSPALPNDSATAGGGETEEVTGTLVEVGEALIPGLPA
jgi:hypothetical protein